MKVGVASASSSAMTALIASGGLSNSASRRSSVASDAMVVGGGLAAWWAGTITFARSAASFRGRVKPLPRELQLPVFRDDRKIAQIPCGTNDDASSRPVEDPTHLAARAELARGLRHGDRHVRAGAGRVPLGAPDRRSAALSAAAALGREALRRS